MPDGGRPATAPVPADFAAALASLRGATLRAEVALTELPPPQRLAPYAHTLGAEVRAGGADLATGRLVLLHDPAGHDSWSGTMRLVTYVRAELEHEIATDPLLGGVGWSWLLDALDAHGAVYTAAGGTVTRAASESFGAMADRPATAEVEVRASWTPVGTDLASHLRGWCDLLCYAGGLPPVTPGVRPIPPSRARATARPGIARTE
jgi:hypothetical protein